MWFTVSPWLQTAFFSSEIFLLLIYLLDFELWEYSVCIFLTILGTWHSAWHEELCVEGGSRMQHQVVRQDQADRTLLGPQQLCAILLLLLSCCLCVILPWSYISTSCVHPVHCAVLWLVLSSHHGNFEPDRWQWGPLLNFPLADSARQCHLENHACLVLLSLFSRWWGLLAQVPTNLGQTRSSCSLSGPWNVKYLNMSKKRSEGWRFRKMTPGLGWPELEQHVGLAFTLEEMGISGGRGSGNAKSGVLGLSSNQISFCDGGSPSGVFFFLCLFVLRQYLSM